MRTTRPLIPAALALLALVLILWWLLRPSASPEPIPTTRALPAAPPAPSPGITIPDPPPATPAASAPADRIPLRIRTGQAIPELFPHQAEREKIFALAATYDLSRIPEIAGYLSHADATVRDAARLALLQLGDAAAIPHLRNARADTSEERELLAEAIAFLEIPAAPARP